MLLIKYLKISSHIIHGVYIVLFVYSKKNSEEKNTILQNWSRKLLDIFNIHLEVFGELPKELSACLMVSNHISWLDIHVINAVLPVRFVAKKEVASWPIFGWFAKKTNTLFIDRQRLGHSKNVSNEMAEALLSGDRICIFPEGTSSDGTDVLRFRPNLFQSVIDANANCLPAAISYFKKESGEPTTATAFIGDMGLIESINNTLKNAPIVVRVYIGSPLVNSDNRKELCELAWQSVVNLRN